MLQRIKCLNKSISQISVSSDASPAIQQEGEEADPGADASDDVSLADEYLDGDGRDLGGDAPPLHHQHPARLPGEGEQHQDGDPRDQRGGHRHRERRSHGQQPEHGSVHQGRAQRRPPGGRGGGGVVPRVDEEEESPRAVEEERVGEEEEAEPGAALAHGL